MVLIAAIATSFTAMGGLKAVVRTGIFQSLIIILSSVILTFALKKLAGCKPCKCSSNDYWKLFRPASDPEYSWIAILPVTRLLQSTTGCRPDHCTKSAGCTQPRTRRMEPCLSQLKDHHALYFHFPGHHMLCITRTSRNPIMPIPLVQQLMPHGLLSLCVAALIAALIDTISSGLNSFSTILPDGGQFRELDEPSSSGWAGGLQQWRKPFLQWALPPFTPFRQGLFRIEPGTGSILAPISVVF
jgi:SSS family solute:Na+ symporter